MPSQNTQLLRAGVLMITLLTIALLTITLLTGAAREAPALQPPAVASQSQAERTTQPNTTALRLRNSTTETLRVEIRFGPAEPCANTRSAATRMLPPGRTWLIATHQPICWRQAVASDAATAGTDAVVSGVAAIAPQWTPWEQRTLQPAQRAEVALTIPGRLP